MPSHQAVIECRSWGCGLAGTAKLIFSAFAHRSCAVKQEITCRSAAKRKKQKHTIELAADIVSAFVSNNSVPPTELPDEIRRTGITKDLPNESVGRVFALGFVLEQFQRNLGDLLSRTREAQSAGPGPLKP